MKHPTHGPGEAASPGEVLLDFGAGLARSQGTFSFDSGDAMTTRKMIPPRYHVREDDRGRYLTCADAPNLAVRVERGFSVSASGARKYPEHTLFLDGAAQGEPFVDSGRHVHNLDHHEGCVRSFTLATCEQAMVMVLKGLDLDGEKWTIFANEPDLDTVLAAWVLLNHRRLASETAGVRRRVQPLVRLEGVIDVHGFELAELTGFPDDLQKGTQQLVDRLRAGEVRQRENGAWALSDPLDHTLEVLMAIDAEVYEPTDFSDDADVEELERVPLVGDRFAIACRAEIGIYEVEQHLRGIHGDRVGLILLERSPGAWTLRQVDPFLPHDLVALYDRLNLLDPEVKGENRWGGSAEIGGSPRRTASGLDLREITSVCRWVFRPPTGVQKIRASVSGAAVAIGVVGLAALTVLPIREAVRVPGMVAAADVTAVFSACLAVMACGVLILAGRRVAPALIGLRRPAGGSWPMLALVVVGVALAGGGWGVIVGAEGLVPATSFGWWYAAYLALGAAAAELVFRGVAHGILAETFPIMIPRGHWFMSVPVVLTASISAALTVLLYLPTTLVTEGLSSTPLKWVVWLTATAAMGLVSGIVRERSASVWPVAAFHATGVTAAWVLLTLFA